jgi:hypothetical protein
VRQRLPTETLAVLDQAFPETHLLTPTLLPKLQDERAEWVLKFAGFDRGQQAWGGRSVQLGWQHTDETWRATLMRYVDLPFPVVAQRLAASVKLSVGYFNSAGHQKLLADGNTRLRSFFVRHGHEAQACGTHLTVVADAGAVSESTRAVQAPVRFSP